MLNARLVDLVAMPPRIARLPRDKHGYPTPWFVATLDDGTRDFRIADQHRHVNALRDKLCWICGERLGAFYAFTIGPMCAVNRVSSEPPAHRDCAVYAAMVCPFLANPRMRRRQAAHPDGVIPPAGEPIMRNPGVALVWVTRTYAVSRPFAGNKGLLCDLGDPTEVLWFAEGRTASRDEVLASMQSGLPLLQEACQRDDDPLASARMLDADYCRTLALLPSGKA